MKKIVLIIAVLSLAVACKSNTKEQSEETPNQEVENVSYASFGEKINAEEALSKEEMASIFDNLQPGDTVTAKFATTVNAVCQAKGCWMKLDLGETESMVKFKDYLFFVPMNIAGEEVIVEGKAYVNEMSVSEQQHYAEDAGKSEEEIAQITEPKRTLSFMADGVLVKE